VYNTKTLLEAALGVIEADKAVSTKVEELVVVVEVVVA
jgi:hypothetical protein